MKKNNPDLLKAFIDRIGEGFGFLETCKAVNLSYDTIYDWTNPDSPRYNAEFSEQFKKAQNKGLTNLKETCLNVILDAAKGKKGEDGQKGTAPIWQAAAWLLERRYKDEFALKHQVSADGTFKLEVVRKVIKKDDK
jgi:hypothetical protein